MNILITDGEFLNINFVDSFVVNVAVESAIQYANTGTVVVGAALSLHCFKKYMKMQTWLQNLCLLKHLHERFYFMIFWGDLALDRTGVIQYKSKRMGNGV
jgi:hypothetical protein